MKWEKTFIHSAGLDAYCSNDNGIQEGNSEQSLFLVECLNFDRRGRHIPTVHKKLIN